MKAWIARWFPGAWRSPQQRLRVAGEYAALANSRHLLADLTMRNFVFAPVEGPPGREGDTFERGVAEGRRRCVLEILELARVDPHTIAALETQPQQRREPQ
jgi:hypothetical protein